MSINIKRCLEAIELMPNLNSEEVDGFKQMCNEGISIAQLFKMEIPTKGDCSFVDASNYIEEEEQQMSKHIGYNYDMDSIGVAEHVYNEDHAEPEHNHLYEPVPGDVKFFQEWLEGHHPSLGCMWKMKNQNPPDSYYDQLSIARQEAYGPLYDLGIYGAPIFRRK